MHQNIIAAQPQKVIPKLETVQSEAYVLLMIAQVATHLQVSRAHVYKLINQGLPTIHLGRSVRINAVSLNRWLSEQETHY